LLNSGDFSELSSEQAILKMNEWLESSGNGTKKINYRFRDWLISRQRYWGAPIPMVNCEKCGSVPVKEEDLPVLLPDIKEFKPGVNGKSPLADIPEWVNTTCPECGGPAKRETDTMDGFACSSWYFLRFINPKLEDKPFNREDIDFWLPVDLYVGGAEHAVMHLLYARFWTKVMYDAGLVSFKEPFKQLRNQGMMLAADGTKMSKSKNNVITPDEMVEKYGADALRAFILFLGTFELDVAWSDEGIRGMNRFVNKVYDMVSANIPAGSNKTDSKSEADLKRMIHKTVKAVSNDLENFSFNTAVARLMEMTNMMQDCLKESGFSATAIWKEAVDTLLKLLAPITPFLAEELWEMVGNKGLVHTQKWPVWDEKELVETVITMPVQVNGKLREQIELDADATAETARKIAEEQPKVQKHLEGMEVVRFIYVPKRMVNFVVKPAK